MARYRIHRIRETPKEQFRWAAHTGGTAVVKPKDYEMDGEVDAATPYAAWTSMHAGDRALRPGDVLETVHEDGAPGDLQIVKYIGFEPAKWWIPEPKLEPKGMFEGANAPAAATSDAQSA
jgi:hypothetical protein